jgi:hypothetical protein
MLKYPPHPLLIHRGSVEDTQLRIATRGIRGMKEGDDEDGDGQGMDRGRVMKNE